MINSTYSFDYKKSPALFVCASKSSAESVKNHTVLNRICFKGEKLNAEPSREDFISKIFKTVFQSIKQENLIGEGISAKVYKFDEDDFSQYVIKVAKNDFSSQNIKINEFPGINPGQPVFKISDNIFILKRKEGYSHSVLNWNEIKDGRTEITEMQAKKFCSDLEKLAKMPDETYMNLAGQIKYLTGKGYKIDSINMAAPLLDFILYTKYEQKLDKEHIIRMRKNANIIAQKCYTAALKTNLPADKQIFEEFIAKVGLYFTYPCTELYKELTKRVNLP